MLELHVNVAFLSIYAKMVFANWCEIKPKKTLRYSGCIYSMSPLFLMPTVFAAGLLCNTQYHLVTRLKALADFLLLN